MSVRKGDITSLSGKTMLLAMLPFIGLFISWPALTSAQQATGLQTHAPYTAVIEDYPEVVPVGEPFFIQVRLDPETLPAGYFVSTLVNVLQSPEGAKPAVLPGFPDIRLILDRPGKYLIEVRVSLVNKSSCGGVEAEDVLRKVVVLQAA